MSATAARVGSVYRVEVRSAPGKADPIGESLLRDAAAMGVSLSSAQATHVYLIQPNLREQLTVEQIEQVRTRLLTDPVVEESSLGAGAVRSAQVIEVHPLPGVMDPVAQSVQEAMRELLGLDAAHPPLVSTGWRYDIAPAAGKTLTAEQAETLATRLLANPVIQRVHLSPYHPAEFPRSQSHDMAMRNVKLVGLTDPQLTRLSRDAHLFLSLEEMQAIRAHYRAAGREPAEIELETLSQTWSEHCVHKTLKSEIRYRVGKTAERDPIEWAGRPGHTVNADGSVTIDNLLKSTVAAATFKLIEQGLTWTMSVFVDNAGVIAFDEKHAVCVKVETHNHPSAIEPYGGAATGVGGCIRDVMGTGLGARPIANTDVFCVAHPGNVDVPAGCLHPKRILTQVVAGVRDYGNRMGIPTVSGAVAFDDRYIGNPLVFCGCVGVLPRDKVKGRVQRGDLIVAVGGRTGRDGIHGATFSSAELTDTHADEFSHAVQIGNAITEKQTLDAIMRARDEGASPLYHGLTDCGAGGFSSAVGEMAKETGAVVHLDRAPLKYDGLSATEIWISEAQERMVLAVPAKNLDALKRICAEESVELAVLGEFSSRTSANGVGAELQLLFHGREVGRISMEFLHDGIPTPHREAVWPAESSSERAPAAPVSSQSRGKESLGSSLLALLSHPNIASKHWIIRQYDHEVRGGTAIKPLVGPLSRGPSDASVIMPVAGSTRGLAVSQGLQTGIGDPLIGGDPYLMALAAIDECVRNLVCVGADPDRIAILDNFCWPSCSKPENLGSLVRAAEGCYDGAMAYRTPFVSGKDSLNNQFTTQDGKTIEIPPTLLITGIGTVPDVNPPHAVTMDAKSPGNVLILVGATDDRMGGSSYQAVFGLGDSQGAAGVPRTDLEAGPRNARLVASLIARGVIASAHDLSDGGLLVAVAEMVIGGSTDARPIGAEIDLARVPGGRGAEGGGVVAAFAETPSRYLLEVRPDDVDVVLAAIGRTPAAMIGALDDTGVLSVRGIGGSVDVKAMTSAWLSPLDW